MIFCNFRPLKASSSSDDNLLDVDSVFVVAVFETGLSNSPLVISPKLRSNPKSNSISNSISIPKSSSTTAFLGLLDFLFLLSIS